MIRRKEATNEQTEISFQILKLTHAWDRTLPQTCLGPVTLVFSLHKWDSPEQGVFCLWKPYTNNDPQRKKAALAQGKHWKELRCLEIPRVSQLVNVMAKTETTVLGLCS